MKCAGRRRRVGDFLFEDSSLLLGGLRTTTEGDTVRPLHCGHAQTSKEVYLFRNRTAVHRRRRGDLVTRTDVPMDVSIPVRSSVAVNDGPRRESVEV